MKKTIKYSLIGIAGILGLLTTIGIVGAIAGVDTKPEAKTVVQTPAVAPQPAKPAVKATPAVKPTPKPSTNAPVTREDAYLIVMRHEYPQLKKTSDKVLLNAGHSVCDMYKAGYTFEEVAYAAIDSGLDAQTAGFLIGASTAAFCPQYSDAS
jgi:hypothetical protein